MKTSTLAVIASVLLASTAAFAAKPAEAPFETPTTFEELVKSIQTRIESLNVAMKEVARREADLAMIEGKLSEDEGAPEDRLANMLNPMYRGFYRDQEVAAIAPKAPLRTKLPGPIGAE